MKEEEIEVKAEEPEDNETKEEEIEVKERNQKRK